MKDYWFRTNSRRWGFVPVSVKGYLLLAALLFLIVITGFATGMYNDVSLVKFVIYFILLIAEILFFGYIASKKVQRRNK